MSQRGPHNPRGLKSRQRLQHYTLSRQPQLPLACFKPLHGGGIAPPTPPSTAGPQSSRARVRADAASGRLCAALPSHRIAQPGPAAAGSPVLQRRRLRVTSPGAGRVDPGEEGTDTPAGLSQSCPRETAHPGDLETPIRCAPASPLLPFGRGGASAPAQTLSPRKQLPSAGGSTLFSLSLPGPFHLSLTSPEHSCGGARPPFPFTLPPFAPGLELGRSRSAEGSPGPGRSPRRVLRPPAPGTAASGF